MWAEKHLSLQAEHISGVANAQVDWLSCTTIDQSEWHLHPDLFHHITTLFGVVRQSEERPAPEIFLLLQDTLLHPWPSDLLYAFPPMPLIPRVIRRSLEEGAEVLLVAPHWPQHLWFTDFMMLSV